MQIHRVQMTNGISEMEQPVYAACSERAVMIATSMHGRFGWWALSVDGVLISADVVMPEEPCDAVA